MGRLDWRGAAVLAGLMPALAGAAGITFGENGAKALSMGGAFAGQADDLTAIQHNPAGLQQLSGFHFLLDANLLNDDASFQRTDVNCGGAGQNRCVTPLSVSNSAGIFVVPFLGVSYGTTLAGRRFTAALGAYGPPADGHYQYANPDYDQNPDGSYVNDPRKNAAQRYGLISSNTLVIYPTLSVSYAVHPRFAVGASVQYVYSSISFSEAVSSNPAGSTSIFTESATWDSIVTAKFTGKPTFTGIFGVMGRPADWLQVGASVRPPIVMRGSGTLNIALGQEASLLAKVQGNAADIELTLPMEIRLGTHFTPTPSIGINADVIYEGWHRMRSIVVTPNGIATVIGGGAPTPLTPIVIGKNWQDTIGLRVGGSYRFGFGLTARAGVLYEPAAAPPETTNLDFPHLSRVMLTAGVGYPLGPVELLLTGVYVPPTQLTVTNSQVFQTNTNNDASLPLDSVGNGTYTAGGWIAGVGIRGAFGGTP